MKTEAWATRKYWMRKIDIRPKRLREYLIIIFARQLNRLIFRQHAKNEATQAIKYESIHVQYNYFGKTINSKIELEWIGVTTLYSDMLNAQSSLDLLVPVLIIQILLGFFVYRVTFHNWWNYELPRSVSSFAITGNFWQLFIYLFLIYGLLPQTNVIISFVPKTVLL